MSNERANTLDKLLGERENLLVEGKLPCKWGVRKYCPKFIGKLIMDRKIGPLWEACGLICIPVQQIKETRRMRKMLERMIESLEALTLE